MHMLKKPLLTTGLLSLLFVLFLVTHTTPALAQEAPAPVVPAVETTGRVVVTDDMVNAVAHRLYCPVCENITLDVCGTAACDDWRYEVRLQLEAGRTEQEIIDDFIARFGDRVFGVPQDPFLNALSVGGPWLIIAGAFAAVIAVFIGWQRSHTAAPVPAAPVTTAPVDRLREQLERDLAG